MSRLIHNIQDICAFTVSPQQVTNFMSGMVLNRIKPRGHTLGENFRTNR